MQEEPSVLDYVKAILTPWRGAPPPIPPLEPGMGNISGTGRLVEANGAVSPPISTDESAQDLFTWLRGLPWSLLAGLILAFAGQAAMEPPNRNWVQGLVLYLLACMGWCLFLWRHKPILNDHAVSVPNIGDQRQKFHYRPNAAAIAGVLSLIAFLAFSDNQFNLLNVLCWVFGLIFWVYAFWQGEWKADFWRKVWLDIKKSEGLRIVLSWSTIFLLAIFAIAAFFRFYRLSDVPPEMFSDHAEKLWDVYDVLHGDPRIFFPRNTGREAVQMYLTAAVIGLFNTGYSFLSLKIGTTLTGFLTLPYVYLLAKELTNRRAALFALFFAGIAYWPNVISRVALRFALYPFFTAPALYYLIRGLRYRRLNDFILSGLFLGIGLQGYSTMRIVPLIFVIAVLIFLVHRQSNGWRRGGFYGLLILAFMALMAFLPLLRYGVENPESVTYRALTRLGTLERGLPDDPGKVFLDNTLKTTVMFFWDNGEIWVHSLPHRPALDIVSAALFAGGIILFMVRYLRRREWTDLFLLISIPLFMLPSTLSLAFPAENPSLNRTGAAIIPVFICVGYAADMLIKGLSKQEKRSSVEETISVRKPGSLAWIVIAVLAFWSTFNNYDLVFRKYQDLFLQSSWNTSELGRVIRNFADSIGGENQAWVIAYPHWVDTRLVGINAGYPQHDYGIWPDDLPSTEAEKRVKLFLIKPDDKTGLKALTTLYPQGVYELYKSLVATKDFYIFMVPPSYEGSEITP